jgi:hypothetical protein
MSGVGKFGVRSEADNQDTYNRQRIDQPPFLDKTYVNASVGHPE